ncbi:MAG: site-specific DNA-methyltransferase, partial [Candidatus Goldbacteria bacterium]|nr:site-specific DNA-methyltransferase [Candidatus Goldiibacteriota bacterium]
KIQTIYIDPPFNLDSSDQFLYRTNYKDANWATLLENRLNLAKDWMNEEGSIFVKCDYNGNMIVRLLLNNIFTTDNFRNEIVVSRISKQDSRVKKLNNAVDYIFFYSKFESFKFNILLKKMKKPKEERWHSLDAQGQGEPQKIFGFSFEPPKGRHWMYGAENMKEAEKNKKIRIVCRVCKYIHTSGDWQGCPKCRNLKNVRIEYKLFPSTDKPIDTNWTDIPGYTSEWNFSTENSERSLLRCILITSNKYDIILDFFLGSGTTTAVAHKLGRKWIGVEMGEHFYTVVLPRMKKVLFYDKTGISKENDVKENYNEKKAGGFFKYYELEQYEETLSNTVYDNHDLIIIGNKNPYEQYVFMKDEKMLKALDIDYENNKVKVNLDKIYANIDIAETLSNLTGKWIKKIKTDEVIFEDGSIINTKELDYKLIKPLIWWE